jgi:origin recognition complex subunit 2
MGQNKKRVAALATPPAGRGGAAAAATEGDDADVLLSESSSDELDLGLEEEEEEGGDSGRHTVSAFFDRDTDREASKRRRVALSQADKHLAGVREWRELPLPSGTEVHRLIRRRQRALGDGGFTLVRERSRHFPQDFALLQRGFNLLFFGLGSKKQLLELLAAAVARFERDSERPVSCVLTLNGFAPGRLRDVLGTLVHEYLGLPERAAHGSSTGGVGGSDVERTASWLAEVLAQLARRRALAPAVRYRPFASGLELPREAPAWERELLLVVHSMDAAPMRSRVVRNALATLAAAPGVRLVASSDSVHAQVLWDEQQLAALNFVLRPAHTLQPYLAETAHKPAAVAREQGSAQGAAFVLRSLTQNHKDVLKVLAHHQLQESETGMTQQDLYEECSRDMIVSSLTQLRRLLVEFKDHKVVGTRKGPGGRELLYISWAPKVVQALLLGDGDEAALPQQQQPQQQQPQQQRQKR